MTHKELDTLWQVAMQDSIAAGEDFARYRFAAAVAGAEREACAKVCETEMQAIPPHDDLRPAIDALWCAARAIRARGAS